jgi:hypothetical protein
MLELGAVAILAGSLLGQQIQSRPLAPLTVEEAQPAPQTYEQDAPLVQQELNPGVVAPPAEPPMTAQPAPAPEPAEPVQPPAPAPVAPPAEVLPPAPPQPAAQQPAAPAPAPTAAQSNDFNVVRPTELNSKSEKPVAAFWMIVPGR